MSIKSITEISNKFTIKRITIPSIIIIFLLLATISSFQTYLWLKSSEEHVQFISKYIDNFFNLNLKQLTNIEKTIEDYMHSIYDLDYIYLPSFIKNIFVLNKNKELVLSYPKEHKLPRIEYLFKEEKDSVIYSIPYYSVNTNKTTLSILDNTSSSFSYLAELDLELLNQSLQKLLNFSSKDLFLVTDQFGNIFASSNFVFLKTQENINHLNFFKKLKKENIFIGVSKAFDDYYLVYSKKQNNFYVVQLTKLSQLIVPILAFFLLSVLILTILNLYLIISVNSFVNKTIAKNLKNLGYILSQNLENKELISELSKLKNKNVFRELNTVTNSLISYLREIDRQNFFLSQKNAELDFLINNLPLWIWYLKSPTTFGIINKNMASFFGTKPENFSYQDIPFNPHFFEHERKIKETVQENKRIFEENIVVRTKRWFTNHKGEKRLISISKIPIYNHLSKKVERVVCFGLDITDVYLEEQKRKKLEKKILKIQKMEAVGTLSAGVAHHFNNLLQSILIYLKKLETSCSQKEYIEKIEEQVKRGRGFVQSLLNISHETVEEIKPINFTIFIHNLFELLKNSYPKNIELKLNIDDKYYFIQGNAGLLEQAILNITNNAKDVLENNPQAKIDITVEEKINKKENKHYLSLQIKDNGPGIPLELQSKLFEPFFTTKEVGKGTGLGLYLAYQIIKSHQGEIDFHSSSQGTTFTLTLPLIEEKVPKEQHLLTTKDNTPKLSTILIVDDEEIIVEGLEEFLTDTFNCKVLKAFDGKSALKLFKENYKQISLIILDLGLPGISGEEILKEIKKIDPKSKVIVSSGYHHHPLAQEPKAYGASYFLGKPYDFNTLVEVLERVVNEN